MKQNDNLGALQLNDGLICCESWFTPGEGPFTVLAKLAIVNVLSANRICQVFGVKPSSTQEATPHSRSLLHLEWLTRSRSAPLLSTKLWSRGLLHQSPRWGQTVSSDRAFRYCPTCLAMGYQSSLCQIDGLARCPQHNDLLLEHCVNCNAPTPRYAITTAAFDVPLVCIHCGKAYAPIWDSIGGDLFKRRIPDEGEYLRLGQWIGRVEALNIQWPDHVGWLADPCAPTQASKTNKRVQMLGVLTSLVPWLRAHEQSSSNVWTGRWPLKSNEPQVYGTTQAIRCEITQARLAIYKSIRRHYARRTGVRIKSQIEGDDDQWIDINAGLIMPSNGLVDPVAHGFLSWRLRFESTTSQIGGQQASCLSLFPVLLFWPIDWSVSDAAWGHFAYRSLLLDIATSRDLCRALKGRDLDYNHQDDFSGWLEIVGMWHHRFGSQARPWPDGLSCVHVPATGGEPGDILLITAASVTLIQGEINELFSSIKNTADCHVGTVRCAARA